MKNVLAAKKAPKDWLQSRTERAAIDKTPKLFTKKAKKFTGWKAQKLTAEPVPVSAMSGDGLDENFALDGGGGDGDDDDDGDHGDEAAEEHSSEVPSSSKKRKNGAKAKDDRLKKTFKKKSNLPSREESQSLPASSASGQAAQFLEYLKMTRACSGLSSLDREDCVSAKHFAKPKTKGKYQDVLCEALLAIVPSLTDAAAPEVGPSEEPKEPAPSVAIVVSSQERGGTVSATLRQLSKTTIKVHNISGVAAQI